MAKYTKVKIVKATKRRLKKADIEKAPSGYLKKTVTPRTKIVKSYPARGKKGEAGLRRYKTVGRKKRKVTYDAIPIFPRF